MAYETQKFLSNYGVRHRLSSMAFPHSNQRAELAVKSMKRLLRENIGGDGKLNTDRFQRAVMQYRNTPDRDTGRSPAQVIFGRELRDFLPAPLSRYKPQQQWLLMQEDREKALRKRALRNIENLSSHTRELQPLNVQDTVQVQNQVGFKSSKWDVTGVVVEVKPHDQYLVKVHGSGRLTLRNRRFLKKIVPYCQDKSPPNIVQPSTPDPPLPQVDTDIHYEKDAQVQDADDLQVVQQDTPLMIPPDLSLTDKVGDREVAEPRRSGRVRVQPERLNIETWKGQTYDNSNIGSGGHGVHRAVHQVDQGNQIVQADRGAQVDSMLGTVGTYRTAPCSIGHYHGLLHSLPGGEGGIFGYGLVDCKLPSWYQTMPWAGCLVTSPWLQQLQPAYPLPGC